MTDTQQLLAEYVGKSSETAFRDLVNRYIDLVYSAAVRLVNGDTHLAQDVTQKVFADLARKAAGLPQDVMLGGWLHRHTCFTAANTMRSERRRQARERQAVEMNAIEDHSGENLALVSPVLDDAINELGAEDRSAILLRFFEQRDFRSVGEALGSNEEAARKRVGRALEKLHTLLSKRGVALSAGALATVLGAQVVSAAPAGLAVSVSAFALAGAAGSTTTLTILKIMSMTKLKAGIAGIVIATGIAVPMVMQHQAKTELREANETLQAQITESERLQTENERLANELSRAKAATPDAPTPSRELLRLRGEVGRLRRELADQSATSGQKSPSALSGLTDNPEMWKMIRDQQAYGLGAAYKNFTNRMNLPGEQGQKLVDLLADNVMENIDLITQSLRDNLSQAQMDRLFAEQEVALEDKVRQLLGPEAFARYQDYTHNMASLLTSEQFKGNLTGEPQEKEAKGRQLYELMKTETQRVLADSGLPADFQTVPTLNFRNIASEEYAEQTLTLLENIYKAVEARADSFLSEQELAKFAEFRTNAIGGNRMALAINRKMMSPGGK